MSAPKGTRGKTTTYTRRSGVNAGEQLRRTTLYLPTPLFKAARKAALDGDLPLSDFVAAALQNNEAVAAHLFDALVLTLGNLRSLKGNAFRNFDTIDTWIEVVEAAIAKARGGR